MKLNLKQFFSKEFYFSTVQHKMICEFPTQRPVTRSFDVFFDLRLNKRLSKQWWGWWFETLSRPFWRHRNEIIGISKGQNSIQSRQSNDNHILYIIIITDPVIIEDNFHDTNVIDIYWLLIVFSFHIFGWNPIVHFTDDYGLIINVNITKTHHAFVDKLCYIQTIIPHIPQLHHCHDMCKPEAIMNY